MKKILPFVLVLALAACGGNQQQETVTETPAVPAIAYTITNVYPHSTDAFTEGLEWHDGFCMKAPVTVITRAIANWLKQRLQQAKTYKR